MNLLLSFPIEPNMLPMVQEAIASLVPSVQFHKIPCEESFLQGADMCQAREQLKHLTAREIQILRRMAGNKPAKEIAGELHLSTYTINNHARNIYRKLGIASRSGAVALLVLGEYGYAP